VDIIVVCQGVAFEVRTCSQEGRRSRPITWHEFKDGRGWCCEQVRCPPGSFGKICDEGDPFSTECSSCPSNTWNPDEYFSDDSFFCYQKTTCDPAQGMRIADPGSVTEDRTCECDLDRGFYTLFGEFCDLKACPAGKQLSDDGQCQKCPLGQFKSVAPNVTSSYGRCVPWTDCHSLGRGIAVRGNSTHDYVCADITKPPEMITSPPPTMLITVAPELGESQGEMSNRKRHVKDIVIIIVPTLVAIALIIIAIGCVCRRKAKNSSGSSVTSTLTVSSASSVGGKCDRPDELCSLQDGCISDNEYNSEKSKGKDLSVDIDKCKQRHSSGFKPRSPDSGNYSVTPECYPGLTPVFNANGEAGTLTFTDDVVVDGENIQHNYDPNRSRDSGTSEALGESMGDLPMRGLSLDGIPVPPPDDTVPTNGQASIVYNIGNLTYMAGDYNTMYANRTEQPAYTENAENYSHPAYSSSQYHTDV